MKTAVMAIWKHRGKDHRDCGGWCPAHYGDVDRANMKSLPKFVLKAIQPVFETLSTDSLLSKCTHGGTQKSNESFHHLIWNRCPKSVFVGTMRLEVAVYDAAIVHNEGEMGRLPIFQMLSFEQGAFTKVGFLCIDRKRVLSAEKQATEAAKTSRKRRQVVQAGTSTSDGSYEVGAF